MLPCVPTGGVQKSWQRSCIGRTSGPVRPPSVTALHDVIGQSRQGVTRGALAQVSQRCLRLVGMMSRTVLSILSPAQALYELGGLGCLLRSWPLHDELINELLQRVGTWLLQGVDDRQGKLAGLHILAYGFTQGRGITIKVQEVVSNLESDSEVIPVPPQDLLHARLSPGTYSSQPS